MKIPTQKIYPQIFRKHKGNKGKPQQEHKIFSLDFENMQVEHARSQQPLQPSNKTRMEKN